MVWHGWSGTLHLENTTWYAIGSLLAQISWFAKSGPDVAFDGLNKKRHNEFLQRVEIP
jgi:hypothetical protein